MATLNHPSFRFHINPLYVLLGLASGLCVFFFWIGTVCVRLWFYKGALGPEPEKFIVLRKDLKAIYRKSVFPSIYDGEKAAIAKNNCMTIFPDITPTSPGAALITALDLNSFTPLPAINVQDIDDFEEFKDPTLQAYVVEEQRISRLPAFVQDDCGDGSEFPNISIALEPIEEFRLTSLEASKLQQTLDYMQLGLKKIFRKEWLVVDHTYVEYHEARAALLSKDAAECILVNPDGEAACEELLSHVVEHLLEVYPARFQKITRDRRKYIRNELTGESFSLVRPFDHHPLEVCARLATEDFQILVKGEFTMQWYLQASATLFPAGFHARKHIGQSLDAIINHMAEPIPVWASISKILRLPALSPYSFAPLLLTRTTTYIQTTPRHTPLSTQLFLQRPMDLFAGNVHDLAPSHLTVRREVQTFRRLPKTGAVVMSCKTSMEKLMGLGDSERRELLKEVEGWGEEEGRFKGRELWGTAVKGWVLGEPVFRDDVSVYGG